MTVKELMEHFISFPYRFALGDGEILEMTTYKDRMQELITQYANRRVKEWRVGDIAPCNSISIMVLYSLYIVVEREEENKNR